MWKVQSFLFLSRSCEPEGQGTWVLFQNLPTASWYPWISPFPSLSFDFLLPGESNTPCQALLIVFPRG